MYLSTEYDRIAHRGEEKSWTIGEVFPLYPFVIVKCCEFIFAVNIQARTKIMAKVWWLYIKKPGEKKKLLLPQETSDTGLVV